MVKNVNHQYCASTKGRHNIPWIAWAFQHSPFFPFVYREILATPGGLDRNAFSVSGNVFFRHSRTSEYAVRQFTWNSLAFGVTSGISFVHLLMSSGSNLGLRNLASKKST